MTKPDYRLQSLHADFPLEPEVPPRIVWQDPPEKKIPGKLQARAREIDRTVEQLKAYPGRWALVARGKGATSTEPWKRRGCQVRSVDENVAGGEREMYARWPETATE